MTALHLGSTLETMACRLADSYADEQCKVTEPDSVLEGERDFNEKLSKSMLKPGGNNAVGVGCCQPGKKPPHAQARFGQ
jgi:hypothetical protein